MSGGECQTKNKNDYNEEDEKPIVALDEGICLFVKLYISICYLTVS